MKKHILFILAIIVGLYGCKKDKPAIDNTDGYKIEILTGNNQTDTLGKELNDQIVVKISQYGNALRRGSVRFETSGCDNNTVKDVLTFNTGIAAYKWRLNGAVGKQFLKIILLDSLGIKHDSIQASATGIMPTRGWYRSSCTPEMNPPVNSFCKLNSGRIIASFNSADYPYYSDDNALNWHPLKSFPSGSLDNIINKLIATSSDEIFAATINNGLYYSNDAGQTWVKRNTGITDPRYFVDMNYTLSGKLIYTTLIGGVYISTDKGNTWRSAMTGLFNERYNYPSEQLNGDLYLISDLGKLYKSTNGGLLWNGNSSFDFKSLFIDDNGDMYAGLNNNNAELYKYPHNGSSWVKLYTAPPLPGVYREIHKLSKQGKKYYFYTYGDGLVSTTDFNSFTKISSSYTKMSRCYISSTQGNLVIGTEFEGIYYNLP